MAIRFSVLLLSIGCASPPAPVREPAPVIDASAPVATADAAPVAAKEKVAPKPRCVAPAIQPGTCVPELGDMFEGAIAEWLKVRGVIEDANYEACRETPFGPEQALVCTRVGHAAIDRSLGIAGPVELRREFVVVVVRANKRVELLVLPLDFGVGDEVVFTARFSADKSGTIDFGLTPDECIDAKKALGTWIENEIAALRENASIDPAFKKRLVAATNLEKTSDTARIDAICKASGHYVLGPKGTLVPAK